MKFIFLFYNSYERLPRTLKRLLFYLSRCSYFFTVSIKDKNDRFIFVQSMLQFSSNKRSLVDRYGRVVSFFFKYYTERDGLRDTCTLYIIDPFVTKKPRVIIISKSASFR